jgi:2-keto-4-pentenoate hydratase/2-oxohepta-3-ene-1,7-dioic acid hydratase in catechol pathway
MSLKLFRFGSFEHEKPGVVSQSGKHLDVSAFGEDYNEAFFASGGIERLTKWLQSNEGSCPEVASGFRFGSCVARPSKIICIGLNYMKHAVETGLGIPKEPIIFFKSTSSLGGPNDDVVIPKNSVKSDWEVELAVIIGKKTSYVKEEDAASYIAGYAVMNDYSEREFQLERGGQWDKGKGCDTFGPLGPYLVTSDKNLNPQNLRLWLNLNGEKLQDSYTADMIFGVYHIVSYVSQFMTLLPGDVISTGTPSGVGMGFKPPRYLKPGDIVELGIEGLGEQKQKALAHS